MQCGLSGVSENTVTKSYLTAVSKIKQKAALRRFFDIFGEIIEIMKGNFYLTNLYSKKH